MPGHNRLELHTILSFFKQMGSLFKQDQPGYVLADYHHLYETTSVFSRQLNNTGIDPKSPYRARTLTPANIVWAGGMTEAIIFQLEDLVDDLIRTGFEERSPQEYSRFQDLSKRAAAGLRRDRNLLNIISGAERITLSEAIDKYGRSEPEAETEDHRRFELHSALPAVRRMGNLVYNELPPAAIEPFNIFMKDMRAFSEDLDKSGIDPKKKDEAKGLYQFQLDWLKPGYASMIRNLEAVRNAVVKSDFPAENPGLFGRFEDYYQEISQKLGHDQAVVDKVKPEEGLRVDQALDRYSPNPYAEEAAPAKEEPVSEEATPVKESGVVIESSVPVGENGVINAYVNEVKESDLEEAEEGQDEPVEEEASTSKGKSIPAEKESFSEEEAVAEAVFEDEEPAPSLFEAAPAVSEPVKAREEPAAGLPLSSVYRDAPQKDALLQILSAGPAMDKIEELSMEDQKVNPDRLDSLQCCMFFYQREAAKFTRVHTEEDQVKIPTRRDLQTLHLLQDNAIKSVKNLLEDPDTQNPRMRKQLNLLYLKMVHDGRILDRALPGEPIGKAIRSHAVYEPYYGLTTAATRPIKFSRNPGVIRAARESNLVNGGREKIVTPAHIHQCSETARHLLRSLESAGADHMMEESGHYRDMVNQVDGLACQLHAADRTLSVTKSPALGEMNAKHLMDRKISGRINGAMDSIKSYLDHKRVELLEKGTGARNASLDDQAIIRSAISAYGSLGTMMRDHVEGYVPDPERDAEVETCKEFLIADAPQRQADRALSDPSIKNPTLMNG